MDDLHLSSTTAVGVILFHIIFLNTLILYLERIFFAIAMYTKYTTKIFCTLSLWLKFYFLLNTEMALFIAIANSFFE